MADTVQLPELRSEMKATPTSLNVACVCICALKVPSFLFLLLEANHVRLFSSIFFGNMISFCHSKPTSKASKIGMKSH